MDLQHDPCRYDIRVRGLLSDTLLSAFPELRARSRDGLTVLVGELSDQAALHGVLARIEALGLELLEVRRVAPRSSTSIRPVAGRPARGPSVDIDPAASVAEPPPGRRLKKATSR